MTESNGHRPLFRNPAVVLVRAVPAAVGVGAATILPWPARPDFASFAYACVVIGVYVVVSLTGGWAVRKSSANRLHVLLDVAEAGARGELTGRVVDDSPDVIGQLGRAVSGILESADRTVSEVRVALATLQSNSREVSEIGTTATTIAEDTATQALEATASAEAVADDVRVAATAAEEMASSVAEIAEHVGRVLADATAATERAVEARSAVQELREASGQVSAIVDEIRAIAAQTHLLALNARIEASRADLAGTGFAVVAAEVKELARRTAEATDGAGRTANEMQLVADRTTADIDRISDAIATVAENQGAITVAIGQQRSATGEIARLSAQAADAAAHIGAELAKITGGTQVLAYGGSQGRNAGAAIEETWSRLSQTVSLYTSTTSVFSANDAARRAVQVNGVTVIKNDVVGRGDNEIEYVGRWCHSTATSGGQSDSYCSIADSIATVRFSGTKARFYGVCDAHHGMLGISVDDGPESIVDEYAPSRSHGALLWESGPISVGTHVLRIRVLGRKSPASRYFWGTIDRVEVE